MADARALALKVLDAPTAEAALRLASAAMEAVINK